MIEDLTLGIEILLIMNLVIGRIIGDSEHPAPSIESGEALPVASFQKRSPQVPHRLFMAVLLFHVFSFENCLHRM